MGRRAFSVALFVTQPDTTSEFTFPKFFLFFLLPKADSLPRVPPSRSFRFEFVSSSPPHYDSCPSSPPVLSVAFGLLNHPLRTPQIRLPIFFVEDSPPPLTLGRIWVLILVEFKSQFVFPPLPPPCSDRPDIPSSRYT